MTTQSVPARLPDFAPAPEPGTRRIIDQQERVYYEGYWIKTYPVPGDCLAAKKNLIEALTRRLFNHTEHGLNVPGVRLQEARAAYEAETDPALRRVKGGMLAGALFNRATDIFRRLVELQADGVEIQTDYPLVQECGHCLLEALELGRLVRHRSGQECIDELWGEPFRVFSLSVEEFFESRYLKIGMCLRDIDRIAAAMIEHLQPIPVFEGLAPLVSDFAEAARIKTETLRTDPDIFDVWTSFVTASERSLPNSARLCVSTRRSCSSLSIVRRTKATEPPAASTMPRTRSGKSGATERSGANVKIVDRPAAAASWNIAIQNCSRKRTKGSLANGNTAATASTTRWFATRLTSMRASPCSRPCCFRSCYCPRF